MGFEPYAELLEFNQRSPIRKPGFTRIRDAFPGLADMRSCFTGTMGEEDFTPQRFPDPERIVEFAGRWDYGEKNARRLGETVTVRRDTGLVEPNFSTEAVQVPIIQKYIDMGHESMLEMAGATFFIECSRVVSHEIVRHRLVSYQQESQRFVKYDEEDPEKLFFMPPEVLGVEGIWFYEEPPDYIDEGVVAPGFIVNEGMPAEDALEHLYTYALEAYQELRKAGIAPQIARYVFPNATRTRIIMKTNAREWRHICKLRLDKSAQPEMQVLMQQVYDQLVDIFPNVMYNTLDGERGVR